jgi:hypothetical protein
MKDPWSAFKNKTSPAGAAAMEVLMLSANMWNSWGFGDTDAFFEVLIEPMANDPNLSGHEKLEFDRDAQEITAWDRNPLPPRFEEKEIKFALFETACTNAVQAIRAQAAGASEARAWEYAAEAKYFLGFVHGLGTLGQTSLAKLGSDARHAENRAMKAQLFEWCSENFSKFKSANAAAMAVCQNLLPIEFSTARAWITEWKKTQSAGTL